MILHRRGAGCKKSTRRTGFMRSLRKKVGHAGRESYKFSFAFQAHGCTGFAEPAQGLPDGAQAMLQIARGHKMVAAAARVYGQCC